MGNTNDQIETTPISYVPPIKYLHLLELESITSNIVSAFRRCTNYTICLDSDFNCNGFRNALCNNCKANNFFILSKETKKRARNERM